MAGMVGGGLPSSRRPSLGDQVTAGASRGAEESIGSCSAIIMILLPLLLSTAATPTLLLHTVFSFLLLPLLSACCVAKSLLLSSIFYYFTCFSVSTII